MFILLVLFCYKRQSSERYYESCENFKVSVRSAYIDVPELERYCNFLKQFCLLTDVYTCDCVFNINLILKKQSVQSCKV